MKPGLRRTDLGRRKEFSVSLAVSKMMVGI